MTISLGAMSSGTALHGSINATPWEYSRSVQKFFGVTGEQHLQGSLHGRDLSAWVLPYGYTTHALLQDAIEAINEYIGLSGSMTWVVNADTKTFTNCVFNGFEVSEDPWVDGAGVNGWQVRGMFKFRQIKS